MQKRSKRARKQPSNQTCQPDQVCSATWGPASMPVHACQQLPRRGRFSASLYGNHVGLLQQLGVLPACHQPRWRGRTLLSVQSKTTHCSLGLWPSMRRHDQQAAVQARKRRCVDIHGVQPLGAAWEQAHELDALQQAAAVGMRRTCKLQQQLLQRGRPHVPCKQPANQPRHASHTATELLLAASQTNLCGRWKPHSGA